MTSTTRAASHAGRVLCLVLALAAALAGLIVAAPARPAHASAGSIPFTALTVARNEVVRMDGPSGNASTISFSGTSLDSITVDSTGRSGFVDKAFNDSKVRRLDVVHRTIADPQPVECETPRYLTISPDNAQLAVYCAGDNVAKIFAAGTLDLLANIPTISNVRAFSWAPDGQHLFIATLGGVYRWSQDNTVALEDSDIRADDLRVLPDGRAVTVGLNGNTDSYVADFFPATGTGATHLQLKTNSGGDTIFTINPAGTILYCSFGVGIRAFSVADGSLLSTINPTPPGATTITGLSMDPSGSYLVEAASDTQKTAYLSVIDPETGSRADSTSVNTAGPAGLGGSIDDGGNVAVTGAPAPTAYFGWTSGQAGAPITFDADAVTAPGTTVANYHWSWGDGTTSDVSTPTTTHTYATASAGGTAGYTVTLTVTDSLGQGGAGTGVWDGVHWFTFGSSTAVVSHGVPVGSKTVLSLTSSQITKPGQHFPYPSTFDITADLGPHSVNYAQASIDFFRDGVMIGSGGVGSGTSATLTGLDGKEPGDHVYTAQYNAMSNTAASDAGSNALSYTIDAVNPAITASSPQSMVDSGANVPVTANITNGCGGGTYTVAVDGQDSGTAMPDAGAQTATVTLGGLADGLHEITVVWTPSTGDAYCSDGESAPYTVRVGPVPAPAPTTTPTTPPPAPAPTTPAPTPTAPTAPTAPAPTAPTVPVATVPAPATTTTVLSLPTVVRPGTLALPVAVTAATGVPVGTVTVRDGTAVVGSGVLVAGKATVAVPLATYGTHRLSASYVPAAGAPYSASTSTPGSVLVDDKPAAPRITGTAPAPGKLQVGLVDSDPHGSPVSSYSVTCSSPKLPTRRGSGRGPVVTVSGLRNNVDYRCSATATNAVGTSGTGPTAKGRPGALPSVTLTTATPTVTPGTRVTLIGTVTAAGQPQAHRTVTLTIRPGSSAKRTRVATTTTDSSGAFRFTVLVSKPGAYQASAPVGPATPTNRELFIRIGRVSPRAF